MIPDEAVTVAAEAMRAHYALEDPGVNDFPPDEYDCCARTALEAAMPHLNQPRIITTAEELDGLGKGSVVLDRDSGCLQFHGDYWRLAGYGDDFRSHEISFPATVLYVPEAAK